MKKEFYKKTFSNYLIGEVPFDIRLFGEEPSGDAAGGVSEPAVSGGAVGSAESVSSDADGQSFSGGDTDPDSEFSRLIRGKYKDAFTKRTQSIINKRFKETRELLEYKEKAGRLISALSERYGTAADDIEGILKAVGAGSVGGDSAGGAASVSDNAAKDGAGVSGATEDGSMSADESDERDDNGENGEKDGSGSEGLRGKNETIRRAIAARIAAGAKAQYARWQKDAENIKALYPSFDLERESENPDFTAFLTSGVSLQRAYECAHYDEIMGGAMEYTARAVSEAISRNIQSKGDRPSENGLGARSAINPKKDVSSLTDGDILRILKQVENGKRISF